MRKHSEVYKLTWAALTTSYALPSKVEIVRDENVALGASYPPLTPANGIPMSGDGEQPFNAFIISYDWTKGGGTLLSFAPYSRTKQDAVTAFRPMTEGQAAAGVTAETQLEKTCALAAASLKPVSVMESSIALYAKSNNASGSLVAIVTLGSL